jgi:hypothetical protein
LRAFPHAARNLVLASSSVLGETLHILSDAKQQFLGCRIVRLLCDQSHSLGSFEPMIGMLKEPNIRHRSKE